MLAFQSTLFICAVWLLVSRAWAGPIEQDYQQSDLERRHNQGAHKVASVSLSPSIVTVTITAAVACNEDSAVSPAAAAASGSQTSFVTISPIPETSPPPITTRNNHAQFFTAASGEYRPGLTSIDINAQFIPDSTVQEVTTTKVSVESNTASTFSPSDTFIFPDFLTYSTISVAGPTGGASILTASQSVALGAGLIPASEAAVFGATISQPAATSSPTSAAFSTPTVNTQPPSVQSGSSQPILTASSFFASEGAFPLGLGSTDISPSATIDPATLSLSNSGNLGIGRRLVAVYTVF